MTRQQRSELKDFLRKRHSVTKLVAHLIFTTKYRRKLIDGEMIGQLRDAMASACEKLECELLEFDGESDHVHLLVRYPPKVSISTLAGNLKSVSSRRIRILNTHIPRQSTSSAFWTTSYFACSAGGASIETLREYVQNQDTPS